MRIYRNLHGWRFHAFCFQCTLRSFSRGRQNGTRNSKCARSNSSGGVIVHLRSLLRIGVAQKIGAHRRRSEIQINLLFVMRVTCFVLLERLQNRSIRFPRPLRLLHRDIAGARSFSRSFRP